MIYFLLTEGKGMSSPSTPSFTESLLGLLLVLTKCAACDNTYAYTVTKSSFFGLKRRNTCILATKHMQYFHSTRHHETLGNRAEKRLSEKLFCPAIPSQCR